MNWWKRKNLSAEISTILKIPSAQVLAEFFFGFPDKTGRKGAKIQRIAHLQLRQIFLRENYFSFFLIYPLKIERTMLYILENFYF